MSDFIGERECVTHHFACDCREREFAEVKAEVARLREELKDYHLYKLAIAAALNYCDGRYPDVVKRIQSYFARAGTSNETLRGEK